MSTCACSAYSGSELLGINSLDSDTSVAKMGARLSCDWRAFTCGQFATTSALEVIPWLSHGDHMVDVCSLAITCHFSATKLITGRFLNMFKNQILNARSLAVTIVIAQMPYV